MKRRSFCLFTALLATVLITACDSGQQGATRRGGGGTGESGSTSSDQEVSALKGTIRVEGSSTVEPITNQAKDDFNETNPDVEISVGGQGTGNGFKSFSKKETDISDASRPIKDKELAACKEGGVEFIEIPIAYDGLTVVINPKNDFVKTLSIGQLKKIFRSDSKAKTWKDIDDSWPAEKIAVFAPGTASGTYDYFVEVVCTEKVDGEKEEIPLRTDQISLNENDKLLVNGVAGDEYAIGFFGYSYYENASDKLTAVPIVNPKTEKAVMPSVATVESGEYAPLSRPLFIYVNVESLDKAEVAEFVDFYLANAKSLSEKADYVGLPEEVYTRARTHVEQRITGTHYLDADGKKREGSLVDIYKESNIAGAE